MGTTTRLTSAVVAPLLERDDALVVLHSSLSEVRSGVGRMLLVSGEAGIGKTALVRSFTASVRGSARVLEGACDALAAPRPLGAFVDIGGGSGDRLRELVAQDPSPHEVFEALSEELAGPPSVLVVEDVHWADEATLDVLRVLGRRIEGVDALVILTYRDDAVGPVHPVRMLLGDLATAPGLGRVALEPLSPQAVAEMAAGYALDAAELHRLTGGNPFYVHEVLEAGGDQVPATVGEVVYTRAARMSEDARSVLESVSVAPPALEPWALEAVCGAAAGALDECLAGGMLVDDDGRTRFRHELARMAIEAELGPSRRRGLHRALLSALGDPTRGIDPAAWPITPRERTTPLPCCSWRRSPRAVLRPSVRTVRRRRSTHAPCGSPRRSPPPGGRSSRRGWPMRCMRPTTRWSRSPPASGRSSISARRAMPPARGTPSVTWSPRTAAAA